MTALEVLWPAVPADFCSASVTQRCLNVLEMLLPPL